MSGDDDIQAQIASIEAQLAAAQQSVAQDQFGQWGQQPQSTFQQAGYGVLQPLQGFPAQGMTAAQAAAAAQKHQFAKDSDDRSVFVMGIPRGIPGQPPVTPEELAGFFVDCGHILTCTVLKDRTTGELKGSAYLEFATHEACGRAIDTKNNALFKGFPLSVTKKRSHLRPRGGGPVPMRGGRGGRGGFAMPDPMQAMMALMAMSAGAAFQPRGRGRGGRGGPQHHQPFQ